MIPRRDIRLYNGLTKSIFRWIFESKKNFRVDFKEGLADYFSNEKLFLLGGGRQSFHLIFDNVDFERGDEVIVPNYYLPVLIPIIKSKGLVPVFCDIDPQTLSIDKNQVLEKINSNTRFVILTHMFGVMQNAESFVSEVKKRKKDIFIIEDSAHAFGSKERAKAGLFGDFSLFSFNYIKTLSTLEGGMLLVNNQQYFSRMKADYEQNYQLPGRISVLKKVFYYYFLLTTLKTPLIRLLNRLLENKRVKEKIKRVHNSYFKNWKRQKLSTFLSFLGCLELESFEEKQKAIDEKVEIYEENLNPDLWKKRPRGEESVWSKYFLALTLEGDSKKIKDELYSLGIDSAIRDEVMGVCEKDDRFKNSLSVYNGIIQLPLHHRLKDKDVVKISKAINSLK